MLSFALLVLLVLAGAALLFFDDWRIILGLLLAHFCVAALIILPERGSATSIAKLITGLAVTAIFWSTMVDVARLAPAPPSLRGRSRIELAFEALLVVAATIGAAVLARTSGLPGLSLSAAFAAYWSPIVGLVIMAFSSDVLKISAGLMFLSTFVDLLGIAEIGGNRLLLLLVLNAVWIAMALLVGFVLFWLMRATGGTRLETAWIGARRRPG